MQIDFKQISNFPNLTPKQQTDYLYELIQRILLAHANQGFTLNDPILLNELDIASKTIKN